MYALISTIDNHLFAQLHDTKGDAIEAGCAFVRTEYCVPCDNYQSLIDFGDSLEPTEWLEVIEVTDMRASK